MNDGPAVLVVDPGEDSQRILRAILEQYGYRVLQAFTAEDGLRMARAAQPDLIITELFGRSGEGWNELEILRADGRTAETPILVVTARATPEARQAAITVGGTRYLTKPVLPQRVLTEARSILGDP